MIEPRACRRQLRRWPAGANPRYILAGYPHILSLTFKVERDAYTSGIGNPGNIPRPVIPFPFPFPCFPLLWRR